MPEVKRQGCSICESVFIVLDEDEGGLCPRCERNVLRGRIEKHVEVINEMLQYVPLDEETLLRCIHDIVPDAGGELARLREKVARLESRGIEDMHEEIRQLRMGGIPSGDWMRLQQWAQDPARKTPEMAFTSGVLRDAARAFEEVAHHRDELREKINEKYWDGIREENGALREQIAKLREKTPKPSTNECSALIEDQIKEWREDDDQGYDTCIDMVCQAEEELRVLRDRSRELEEFALMLTQGIPDQCRQLGSIVEKGDAAAVKPHLDSYVAAIAKEVLGDRKDRPTPGEIWEAMQHLWICPSRICGTCAGIRERWPDIIPIEEE